MQFTERHQGTHKYKQDLRFSTWKSSLIVIGSGKSVFQRRFKSAQSKVTVEFDHFEVNILCYQTIFHSGCTRFWSDCTVNVMTCMENHFIFFIIIRQCDLWMLTELIMDWCFETCAGQILKTVITNTSDADEIWRVPLFPSDKWISKC